MTTTLYRYENVGCAVVLEKHPVLSTTPKGFWIRMPYSYPEKRKFVLKPGDTPGKRFAWPTVDEAKVSFFARKRRQLGILRAQIEHVEAAVEALQEGRLNDYGTHMDFDL